MNIFLDDGFLDINAIAKIDEPFKIIIGSRQIGKTYGLSKWLIDNNRRFIYMRRLASEIEFITANEEDNPFMKVYRTEKEDKYALSFYKNGKYIYNIYNINDDEKSNLIGISLALGSVAKIRGFNADRYTDIFYDEFIPEKHVSKIRNEADALFNAYETINSNRELNGEKPVNLWLLGNSNNLNNPILEGLGLIRHIEKMKNRGQIISILHDRGIVIINIENSPISNKKRETALYKATKNTEFQKMALSNEFAYNDFSNITSKKLIEYRPLCTIGNITILTNKNLSDIYAINKKIQCRYNYDTSTTGIQSFKMNYGTLYYYYIDGSFYFDSFETKNFLLQIFGWYV